MDLDQSVLGLMEVSVVNICQNMKGISFEIQKHGGYDRTVNIKCDATDIVRPLIYDLFSFVIWAATTGDKGKKYGFNILVDIYDRK